VAGAHRSSGGDRAWSAALAELDQNHIWHPYAPLPAKLAALPVRRADGVHLELYDGRRLVDGMASWWCVIHGYRHPRIVAALEEQLQELPHVMFGGLTHRPAVELGRRLIELTPKGLDRVFFSDSGSVSVEVALKIALQYHLGRGERRRRILTIRGGYHGDTFGAMSVCDPVGGMHHLFRGFLPRQLFLPRPPGPLEAAVEPRWLEAARRTFDRRGREVAAVIIEPVVQGAGGMHFYSPAYLRELAALARSHGALLIFDEIATGFGRTGTLFALQRAGVVPDVLCVGKALTGGCLTLAATITSEAVARAVCAGEGGALMHGPTYMANPLACAAGLASLQLLAEGRWRGQVAAIEAGLREGLAPARRLPWVREVRVLGAIGVIEGRGEVDVAKATAAAVEKGVWLRPFRNLIYAMPPYVIEAPQLKQLAEGMVAAAAACG